MQLGGERQQAMNACIVGSLQLLYRWLFFIEGGLTCILAIVALYIIPDFPTTPASWLTAEEQMLAQQRLEEDLNVVVHCPSKNVQRSGLVEALSDWTMWWLAIALTALNAALSFGAFFPILVATMGYGPTTTLLLCSPPWIVGVITSFFITRFVLPLTHSTRF